MVDSMHQPLRLVLDTNVVVAGLLWNGPPRHLLEAAIAGEVELFSSAVLLDELAHTLGTALELPPPQSEPGFRIPAQQRQRSDHAVQPYEGGRPIAASSRGATPTVGSSLRAEPLGHTAHRIVQRRQVLLDDEPDSSEVNTQVTVHDHIAEPGKFTPGNLRFGGLELIRSASGPGVTVEQRWPPRDRAAPGASSTR